MRKSNVFEARGVNATVKDVKSERDTGHARLLDHSGARKTVTMLWDLPEPCPEDQIFKLTIGNESALLNAEELRRYLRWI